MVDRYDVDLGVSEWNKVIKSLPRAPRALMEAPDALVSLGGFRPSCDSLRNPEELWETLVKM